MSSSTTTETRSTPSGDRGKRGNRGHGHAHGRGRGRRGGRGGGSGTPHVNKTLGHAPASANNADDVASKEDASKSTLTNISNAGSFADANTAATDAPNSASNVDDEVGDKDDHQDGDGDGSNAAVAICWICAEPVKYYSLSACNHRTCHVCALRLRALYKKLECTFCKEPQMTVIFTTSPDADFASYAPDAIPYKDAKLAIFFETEDMMEETMILLRYNCPDGECGYMASGWGDLKLHTRGAHGKTLCDLCIRLKKVFSHEHVLYPPNMLPLHLPSIPHRASKLLLKEPPEGGVHPLCEFCRECSFDDDELFVHMRQRHEECFICKRNEIRDQYFQNYENLELHFSQAHYACANAICQAQKFVVFESELDLKAHQVEVHGHDMSSKDRRDARRVQAEFEFDGVHGAGGAGGGGRRGRRDRGDREREREPPPPPSSSALQAVQLARGGPVGRRRAAFGGQLSAEGAQTATTTAQLLVLSGRVSPIRDDVDPLVAEGHAAFVARLQSLAPNPNNAITAVKAAMRGYRANESSARDLISTIWNVLDHDLDDTASIVNAVVDLLEEEGKKRDLLAAWNGFKIEQRQQFPDLVPTAVGSGYAGIASGRVLNAKHATASRSSQQSSRQLWDRVAQAASSNSGAPLSSTSRIVPGAGVPPPSATTSSSSTHHPHTHAHSRADRFPPLGGPAGVPAFRQPQRHTPWTSSTSVGSAGSSSAAVTTTTTTTTTTAITVPISPKKKATGRQLPPPSLSATAFPVLPTAQPTRAKPPAVSGNTSLKNILGEVTPAASAWKVSGNGDSNGNGGGGGVWEESVETTGGGTGAGKGKKGKGKQKQTLFTLGSFPT